jgi:hypothetical protein
LARLPLVNPADRTALVVRYLDLASRPLTKWGNESRWIRQAYKLVAAYIENGGCILTGYLPQRHIPERWVVDRRSASRVREDIGLDPLDGLIVPPHYDHEFAQANRVFRAGKIERIVDAQSGL